MSPTLYKGRFAPSPTGLLHKGSLVAAAASYLDARVHHGHWTVRIEDLDRPREVPGAARTILSTLAAFGFRWDGDVVYQSQRSAAYQKEFERLTDTGLVFPCACSRRDMAGAQSPGAHAGVYPGTCRKGLKPGYSPRAWRLRVPEAQFEFVDRGVGMVRQHLGREVGDFVIARTDGTWAYQLAVVVDDSEQGITDVVRGMDLLDSTPRQIYLQKCLGYQQPRYLHVPLVVNALGQKLSKQTGATALETSDPLTELMAAVSHLGFPPPVSAFATLAEFWQWAASVWAAR